MSIISTDVAKAIELLNNEDVVSIPTETVYGLAGNIFSEQAISKIFRVKGRPRYNPLIVHTSSIAKVNEYVSDFPEKARQLAEAFWPGSLTLILNKRSIIPDLITAGKQTVGVRIPNHPVTLDLLSNLEFPLAAPSANPFGSISPTCAGHVAGYFKDQIPMVLDGGQCNNGIESTIVGFDKAEPVIYRLGSISMEDISRVVGRVALKNKSDSNPTAPGMLSRHYAPNTRLFLVPDVNEFINGFSDQKIGVLTFGNKKQIPNGAICESLSENQDFDEAAANLYGALHRMDRLGLDMIVAEMLPDHGLGRSINDRLLRATRQVDS